MGNKSTFFHHNFFTLASNTYNILNAVICNTLSVRKWPGKGLKNWCKTNATEKRGKNGQISATGKPTSVESENSKKNWLISCESSFTIYFSTLVKFRLLHSTESNLNDSKNHSSNIQQISGEAAQIFVDVFGFWANLRNILGYFNPAFHQSKKFGFFRRFLPAFSSQRH